MAACLQAKKCFKFDGPFLTRSLACYTEQWLHTVVHGKTLVLKQNLSISFGHTEYILFVFFTKHLFEIHKGFKDFCL
ncbi:hypothetical protein Y1Q_0023155 [Alligator mississippiensis]|uniref:Uncharacterized protein n=1 Tax=Alligator mississippiensis TaxID=8496 RepID=A0A151MZ38_ALLMI|nr:hypothetical protein Y1Q_0023155 [Alligator mississippiensis]